MSIRAIIWDLGGVLVRTEDHKARLELAAHLGMSVEDLYQLVFDSESARLATLGKLTTQAHWEIIRQKLNLLPEEFSMVPKYFWGGDTLDAALVEYIRALRPHYKTALLSNAWDDLRGVLANEWEIVDAFDDLFISAELGVAKPDPQIYHLALERLGVSADEAVFIDDFARNIDGALAIGLHTIRFQNPAQARADLELLLNQDNLLDTGTL